MAKKMEEKQVKDKRKLEKKEAKKIEARKRWIKTVQGNNSQYIGGCNARTVPSLVLYFLKVILSKFM